MIFRELIDGKYLCDATSIILWYIIYVGSWVLGQKSLMPSRKTLPCGCMGLVLFLGFSPYWHGVGPALGYESQKTRGMTCPWVRSQNTRCTLYNKFCVSSFCTKSRRNSTFKFLREIILYLSINCLVWRITKTRVWQKFPSLDSWVHMLKLLLRWLVSKSWILGSPSQDVPHHRIHNISLVPWSYL